MRPVLFSIGPFHLYSFGVMILLGVLLSLYAMMRRPGNPRDRFLTYEEKNDFVLVTLVSGLVGARLFYVLENVRWYGENPLRIFAFWEGGLVFFGGVITSLGVLYWLVRRKQIVYFRLLDFLMPYVALTHGFGRLGCFLNGCCAGKECLLPWAVQFPGTPHAVHPTQLYEAFFLFLLFGILRAFYRRQTLNGRTLFLYFLLYGTWRFFVEFLRVGNPSWQGLTFNQWISLLMIAAAAAGFYFLGRERKRGGPSS